MPARLHLSQASYPNKSISCKKKKKIQGTVSFQSCPSTICLLNFGYFKLSYFRKTAIALGTYYLKVFDMEKNMIYIIAFIQYKHTKKQTTYLVF